MKSRLFRILIGPGLLVVASALQIYSFRTTALVLSPVLVITYVHFLRTAQTKWLRLILVAFVISILLPVDVTFRNVSGPPRFVPLIMGAPTEKEVALEQRGEVVLGGCILRGNEPRWVWVW